MRKKIISMLLCVALLLGAVPASAVSAEDAGSSTRFTDIADQDIALAAETLRGLGIISGTTETTFAPDALLTRAHVCKIIVNAMGLSSQVGNHVRRTLFSDVLAPAWYAGYVNLTYSKGIINGYGDGTFRPDQYITYGQLAAILLRMLGYTTAEVGSVWPTDYTAFCESLGITGDLELDPYQTLSRGQAAVLVRNALLAEKSGGKAYYQTISGVQSVQNAMILSTDAASGQTDGLLKAAVLSSGTAVKYYSQVHPISDLFAGYTGELLLDTAGCVVGFIPDDAFDAVVTIQTADTSNLTDSAGTQHKLADDARLIVGETVYAWSSTGYLQANCWVNETAWLFCNTTGAVSYVYIPSADPKTASEREVSTSRTVILLSASATDGSSLDQLMVYQISGNTASVEYVEKSAPLPYASGGRMGELLLNKDEKAVGFIPSAEQADEFVVSSVKLSGIADGSGALHRISGSAVTIVGDALYTWKDTGYLQMQNYTGRTVRLYHDDSGAVVCVQLITGAAGAATEIMVAQSKTPVSEAARTFAITGTYSVTKNGAIADSEDLAQGDLICYDAASRTLRASDRRLTGYIEAASPALDCAETITVAGCTLPVLESAWEALEDCGLYDRVTLLLTDDGKVGAVSADSGMDAVMIGVLSTNGKSVTLLGSGLTLTAAEVDADAALCGRLVEVRVYRDSLSYSAYESAKAGSLNIAEGTLGSYELAPSYEIYEHAGSSDFPGYVYSLSGEQGVPSYDFSEITWTDTLPASRVSLFHLNSAGQVDMLLLQDVTGNCYEYGQILKYTGNEGINLGTAGLNAYNAATTITNSDHPTGSKKHLCAWYIPDNQKYCGIALGNATSSYASVTSLSELQKASHLDNDALFLMNGVWYADIGDQNIPVSENVQIYLKSQDQWLKGESGLKTVLALEFKLDVYYDRSITTGAQIRVITASAE